MAPGIERVEAPLGERYIASYILKGVDACLVVDTGLDGTARSTLVPAIQSAQVDLERVRYVLSTHSDFDHTGGNAAVRKKAPNALFLAGHADRDQVEDIEALLTQRYGEFRSHGFDESEESKRHILDSTKLTWVDITVHGGEVLRLEDDWHVEVVHTPGHTWGSVSIFDPRSEALIVGDAVLGDSVRKRDGSPAFPPTYRYVDSYLATIQRLRAMQPALLLTSHYPVMGAAEAQSFLAESRSFAEHADRLLRAKLAKGSWSLLELTRQLAPEMGDWEPGAADYLINPLYGHLERLVAHGSAATAVRDDGVTVWTSSAPVVMR